ncbi:nuclear transcription factor Y subunit gamma-like [Penaeus monodon]|uniref:nuclear transcription factor Y subunit gamma-like n=1 Tax=Penaeus monodon TaxID=6687 RepID=UPI0018A7D7C3|nr:nuclear transcription factor Y subunit gamma-like [Penaeus monodon]
MSVEGQIDGPQPAMTEAQQGLNNFWPKVTEEIRQLTQTDLRQQELPLARIKRIMKLDEDVKMISAEAPVLFSKAAEIFITELTLRAWIHTEDNKRRTLQRNDIAMAITKYDQFDFLIDIVPRDELKPPKSREESSRTGVPADQHYYQIAQHYQAVLQQSTANNSSSTAQTTVPQQTSAQPQTIQIVQAGGQVSTVQTTGTTASTTQPQQQTAQIIQLHGTPGHRLDYCRVGGSHGLLRERSLAVLLLFMASGPAAETAVVLSNLISSDINKTVRDFYLCQQGHTSDSTPPALLGGLRSYLGPMSISESQTDVYFVMAMASRFSATRQASLQIQIPLVFCEINF